MAVVAEEIDIGDVTAVPAIHVAGSLGSKTGRELSAKRTLEGRQALGFRGCSSTPSSFRLGSCHLCRARRDTAGTQTQPRGVPARRESGLARGQTRASDCPEQ